MQYKNHSVSGVRHNGHTIKTICHLGRIVWQEADAAFSRGWNNDLGWGNDEGWSND